MEVRKSNGALEEFQSQKIFNSIVAAYQSVNVDYDSLVIDAIIKSLYIYDKISTSEIDRQVSDELMSVNKKVARSYINMNCNKSVLKKNDDFTRNYINASNAATGSKYDANANVSNKNIVTLGQELHKGENIQQNRYMMHNKIKNVYSKKLADQYIQDLESHTIYRHDESGTPGFPYCVAITMFPFLTDGLTKLGGISVAPTDLKSYCGEFINLVYSVSSQFMGAVATPEFLMYMDYFIRKDYGDNYLDRLNDVVDCSVKQRTLEKVIENCFQQVVHSMNMPAGNRGYQTVFWNVGYFDKPYFDGVFGEFLFPDGSKPIWETLSWLQKKFMKWFNAERTKYILTFPVETMAMLTDGTKGYVDDEYYNFTAEMLSEGHSFFIYTSDSPDSLSSCCRLRNSLKDNASTPDDEHNHTTHQFSMGTASVATGSKCVMTIDLNKAVQDATRRYATENGKQYADDGRFIDDDKESLYAYISEYIAELTSRVHKYLHSFNEIVKDFYKAHMLTVYDAGFIDMKKQYLTVGVNGLTDAAEFLGLNISPNDDYEYFVNMILETINKVNKKDRTKECMYNTEFIPGENVSYKHYEWDKNAGYYVSPNHVMYSSYFYNPEDVLVNPIDKFKLHGKNYVKYLDGGSALHLNLNEHLSKEQYKQLLLIAAENGTNYWTVNVRNSYCEDCGYISKHTVDTCPHCGSKNISWLTRVIGYLKKIRNFSEARQEEASHRYYA